MRPIHHRCAHVAALLVLSAGQSFADPVAPSAPPVARVEAVTESHFGDKVTDPYRWMENDQDRDWLTFFGVRYDYTRSVLDALPTRKGLLARIQQLSADITAPGQVRRSGGRLFFQQRPAGANNYKLFVREGGKDRLLVDPTALDTTDGHYSLDWWVPSPDGTKLANGLSKDGSQDSTLQIMEVATGRWDPSPWRDPRPSFTFPTRQEWMAALARVKAALDEYPNLRIPLKSGTKKMLLIYAWNEFGEGGIVAPTQSEKKMKLEAVHAVFGR